MTAWTKGPIAKKIDWDEVDSLAKPENARVSQDLPTGNVEFGDVKPSPANDWLEGLKSRLVVDGNDPYFVASVEGQLVDCNELYRGMAQESGGLLPLLGEDGGRGQLPSQIMAVVEEVQALERPMRYNERHMIDGKDRMFSARYVPVFADEGSIVAIVAVFRDITEKAEQQKSIQEMRQKLNDFARSTSDWFWEVDRHFRITSLSDRFTAITGRPSVANIGKRLDEIGDFQLNRQQGVPAYQAIKGRKPFRDQHVLVETDAGEQRMFQLSGVPVFDPSNGSFVGYRGAGVDISENLSAEDDLAHAKAELERALTRQRMQNKELERARVQAEAALQAKDDFLGNMSHELRTPLNAILGFAQAMKHEVSGPLSEEYQGYVSDIEGAGEELLGLVGKLLDASAEVRGEEEAYKVEPCQLKDILVKARAEAFARVDLSGMDLSGLAVETDLVIKGDFDALVDVFASILNNAARYTPKGKRFGLRVGRDDEGTRARVTIWDSGPGVPAEDIARVFERLSGTDKNPHQAASNGDGAGLSLYLARQRVRDMGGDISLETAPGSGCKFHVYLPL